MRKILTGISTISLYLATAPVVFAQGETQKLNPCEGTTNELLKAACATDDLGRVIGFVVTIAFIIAVLVALLFLIWGGLKWITSGGDKAGVEAARNQIIAAVIGLIVVFLAFFILNLVLGLFGTSLFDLTLPTITQN